MPEGTDSTFKNLTAQGLRQQGVALREQALAAYAGGDVDADKRFSDAALANEINADLIGGSPHLTPEENRELWELQSRFDKFMDNGETSPGGLTRPEYEKLGHLLKKAGSVEEKKDPRR